jgi:hypothetical protein
MRILRQALSLVYQPFDQISSYNGDEEDVQQEREDQLLLEHGAEDYQAVREARQGIGDYFYLYNTRRPHQSLKLSDTGRGILWKEELTTIMYVIVYRAVT